MTLVFLCARNGGIEDAYALVEKSNEMNHNGASRAALFKDRRDQLIRAGGRWSIRSAGRRMPRRIRFCESREEIFTVTH